MSIAQHSSGSALTAVEYARRANAVCAAGTVKANALGDGPGNPIAVTSARQLPPFAAYLTAEADVTAAELEQLRALPTSPTTATQVKAAYLDLDQAIGSIRTAAAAAKSEELGAFRKAITAVITESDSANAAALDAGLTTCGS